MGKSLVRHFLHLPSRQGKTFHSPPPLLKSGNFLCPPPLQYGLNFKLPRKNHPKTFCVPPPAWLKHFPPPPPFRRGETSLAPLCGKKGNTMGAFPGARFETIRIAFATSLSFVKEKNKLTLTKGGPTPPTHLRPLTFQVHVYSL